MRLPSYDVIEHPHGPAKASRGLKYAANDNPARPRARETPLDGHATPAHQADEDQLQPLGQAVTMLDRV